MTEAEADQPQHGCETAAERGETDAGSVRLWVSLLALAVYALLIGVPQVSFGRYSGLASVLATLLFTILSVALVVQVARLRLGWGAELAGMVLAAGLWQAADWGAGRGDLARLYLGALSSLAFLFLCVAGGRLLSRLLRDRNILLPVAVVAILADIFTVAIGPTGKALEHAPELVQKFSVGLPAAGSAAGPEGAKGLAMLASMGIGDFVFLALFLTAAARFGLPLRRGGAIMATLVCLALAAYFLLPPVLPGIPLLPFIAGGFLLAYAGRLKLSRTERQALLWGGLLLTVLFAVAAWMMKAGGPPTPPEQPSPGAPASESGSEAAPPSPTAADLADHQQPPTMVQLSGTQLARTQDLLGQLRRPLTKDGRAAAARKLVQVLWNDDLTGTFGEAEFTPGRTRADGKRLHLLTFGPEGTGNYEQVWVIHETPSGVTTYDFEVSLKAGPEGYRPLRDLNGDGEPEVLALNFTGEYEGIATSSYWVAIYRWTGSTYGRADERFPQYYAKVVVPDLERRIQALRTPGLPYPEADAQTIAKCQASVERAQAIIKGKPLTPPSPALPARSPAPY